MFRGPKPAGPGFVRNLVGMPFFPRILRRRAKGQFGEPQVSFRRPRGFSPGSGRRLGAEAEPLRSRSDRLWPYGEVVLPALPAPRAVRRLPGGRGPGELGHRTDFQFDLPAQPALDPRTEAVLGWGEARRGLD